MLKLFNKTSKNLVTVGVLLEGTICLDANVVGLLLAQLRKVGTKCRQMQCRHLLVQLLGQQVDIVLVLLRLGAVFQDVQLRQHLVGEGAGHHEGRVTSGTSQVHKPAGGQHNDSVAVGENKSVHLRLDVLHLDAGEVLEVLHGNLVVKVPDVAHDGVVLHLLHVVQRDDLEVASGRSENVHLTNHLLGGHHLEALHARLQRANGVNLCDQHAGACTPHSKSAALAHISIACHKRALATDHHVRGTHDAVRQGVAAAVHVVEFRLSHTIVDVDGWEQQLTLGSHLTKTVHTRSGLLTDTLALGRHARVLRLVRRDGVLQQLQDALVLRVGGAGWVWQAAILCVLLLELLALVHQQCGITSVIHELVAAIRTWHCHHLLRAPPVLWQGLALPGKHCGCAGLGNGSRSVVLRAEDVARAPAHLCAQSAQSLDEHTCLDGHVQRAVDVQALERLPRAVLLPGRHEAWHLVLSQGKLLAAELCQAHVLDLGVRHGRDVRLAIRHHKALSQLESGTRRE